MQIALNQTPFYAEAGGQVGDTGLIRTETGRARVTDTKKTAGVFIHFAEVEEGEIAKGQAALHRSGLAVETLERVWALADIDGDGRLNLSEFLCCCALVRRCASAGVPPPDAQQLSSGWDTHPTGNFGAPSDDYTSNIVANQQGPV